MIQEFGRSPELAERIGDLAQPIDLIERVIARGIERGEFRQDIDSRVAATIVYGGIDELLTALGARPAARRRGRRRGGREDVLRDQPPRAAAAELTSSAKRAAPTFPPERITPTVRSRASTLPAEERRDADRSARLGDELQPVVEEDHRRDDLRRRSR